MKRDAGFREKPRFVRGDLSLWGSREITDEAYVEKVMAQGQDLAGTRARDFKVLESMFRRVSLADTVFDNAQLLDAAFEECDLANASWNKVNLQRVEVIESRMVGFKAHEASLKDVRFVRCNGSMAQFRLAKLRNVTFEGCDLKESDFYACDMQDVRFTECDLAGVEMSHAKLREVDLRGSRVEGIRIGADQIAGTVIEPTQASYLLGVMGAKIRWLGEE